MLNPEMVVPPTHNEHVCNAVRLIFGGGCVGRGEDGVEEEDDVAPQCVFFSSPFSFFLTADIRVTVSVGLPETRVYPPLRAVSLSPYLYR